MDGVGTRAQLAVGTVLTTFGALGMALGVILGVGSLGRPWAFVAGFLVGIATGLGCVLVVDGLATLRRGSH